MSFIIFFKNFILHLAFMSKKLVNHPDTCVEEFIQGTLASNPNLLQVEGINALVHRNIMQLKDQQVTLISGNICWYY
jgi:hypothetical protein